MRLGILRRFTGNGDPVIYTSLPMTATAEDGHYSWVMYATTLGVALVVAYYLFYKQPFIPPDDKAAAAGMQLWRLPLQGARERFCSRLRTVLMSLVTSGFEVPCVLLVDALAPKAHVLRERVGEAHVAVIADGAERHGRGVDGAVGRVGEPLNNRMWKGVCAWPAYLARVTDEPHGHEPAHTHHET